MALLGSGDITGQEAPLYREDLTNATSLRIPFNLSSFPHANNGNGVSASCPELALRT